MEWLRYIKEIAAIGGWIVVSIFFMAQAAGYIPSQDAKTLSLLQEHDISLSHHRTRQEDLISRLTIALKVMCENGAKTASERNNCLNIR